MSHCILFLALLSSCAPNTWHSLAITSYTMAALDARQTIIARETYPNFNEYDPLARPFVKLPTPAYYSAAIALTTGTNWLALKMAHSSHRWERSIWWLPQAMQISGNVWGYQFTLRHR